MPTDDRRRHGVAVALVAVLLVAVGAGATGLWEPWETAVAGAARGGAIEQAAPGPPLRVWLGGAAFGLLGDSEWAARLPSLLAGLLLIWLLLAHARRWLGEHDALATVLVLGTMPLFLVQSRQLLGNAPQMLGEALCLLSVARLEPHGEREGEGGRWAWIGLLAGALITWSAGGTRGLAIPTVAALLHAYLADGPRRSVRRGALGLLTLSLALFAAGRLLGFGEAVVPADRFELLFRAVGYGAFPWCILLLPALALLLFDRESAQGPRRIAADLSLSWFVVGVVIAPVPGFSSAPAIALGIGACASARRPQGVGASLAVAFVLATAWMLWKDVGADPTRLVAAIAGEPPIKSPSELNLPWLYQGLTAAWVLLIAAWLVPWTSARLPAPRRILAVLSLGAAASFTLGYIPQLSDHLSERGVIDTWERLRKGDERLYRYLVPTKTATYYAGSVPTIGSSTDFLSRLRSDERVFALIPTGKLASVNRTARKVLDRHVPVLDDRSSRLMLLSNRLLPGEEDRNPISRSVSKVPPEKMDVTIGADLDGLVEVIGADLPDGPVRLGRSFELTYHFKVKRRISKSWKVFVHIETGGHRLDTGGSDHDPVGGLYPTTNWEPGDYIADTHRVEVPIFSPTGRYKVLIGLFVGDDRMKASPKQKHDGSDRVRVGSIEIEAI
jgi:4-amino-4-deoxy-L-arabinose transferase-like glycosyltransferase